MRGRACSRISRSNVRTACSIRSFISGDECFSIA
jgi:hypothetical protein